MLNHESLSSRNQQETAILRILDVTISWATCGHFLPACEMEEDDLSTKEDLVNVFCRCRDTVDLHH